MPDINIRSVVVKKKILEALDDAHHGRHEHALLKSLLVLQRLADRHPDSEEPIEEGPLPAKT